MKPGANNERVYRMAFASVYPPLIEPLIVHGFTPRSALNGAAPLSFFRCR
ncbi:MAG TPA: hypothetical protein VGE21_00115 [Flavobacteriales bacterium]